VSIHPAIVIREKKKKKKKLEMTVVELPEGNVQNIQNMRYKSQR
jgi:hypothetical protein